MQITETTNEGLKRAYTLTIPAKDIDARIGGEIKKLAPQIRMPGFRPGKVPANLVRKMHGEQLHAQAINDMIRESVDTLMKDKELRPAMQPKIELDQGYDQGKDAELSVELEVLPKVDAPDVDGLKLERLTVPVADEQVDEMLGQLAGNNKSYKDAAKSKKASDGDQLIIDFVGRVDGEEFEGGAAENTPLVLGSGQFIPGFEEQLTGVKTGDKKTITVTFPEDYQAAHLAGKDAEFDITVQQVKVETDTEIDDDFAKNFGLDGLDKLKELLRAQIEQETNGLTRTQMKRQLLDQLAAGHDFAVPQTMVDAEFEQIWAQLQQEAAQADDPEAAMKEVEDERDDYRRIAERRVRPTALMPVWHVAGYALGAATAMMGERAAMACTAAIEEVIDDHYAQQAALLGDDEAELRDTIEKFREDELEHRDTALEHDAELAPGYEILSTAIKKGSRLAIWLSQRV